MAQDTAAGPKTVRLRLTIHPDEEREYLEDEVESLRHQGLVLDDEPAGEQPAGKAAGGKPATGGAQGAGKDGS